MAWTSPALPFTWYKEVDRPTAEAEISPQAPGAFLVRPSSVVSCYALTVKLSNGGIYHTLIRWDENLRKYHLDGRHTLLPSVLHVLYTVPELDKYQIACTPTFFDQPWFWGDIPKEEAMNKVLSKLIVGAYLGRTIPQGFAITFALAKGRCAHLYVTAVYEQPPWASGKYTPSRWKLVCSDPKFLGAEFVLVDHWQEIFKRFKYQLHPPLDRPDDQCSPELVEANKFLWHCSIGNEFFVHSQVATGYDYHFGLQNGLSPVLSVLRIPSSYQYLLEQQHESLQIEAQQLALKMVKMFKDKDGIHRSLKPPGVMAKLLAQQIDPSRVKDPPKQCADELRSYKRIKEWDHTQMTSLLSAAYYFSPNVQTELISVINPQSQEQEAWDVLTLLALGHLAEFRKGFLALPEEALPTIRLKLLYTALELYSVPAANGQRIGLDEVKLILDPKYGPLDVNETLNANLCMMGISENLEDVDSLKPLTTLVLASLTGDAKVVQLIVDNKANVEGQSYGHNEHRANGQQALALMYDNQTRKVRIRPNETSKDYLGVAQYLHEKLQIKCEGLEAPPPSAKADKKYSGSALNSVASLEGLVGKTSRGSLILKSKKSSNRDEAFDIPPRPGEVFDGRSDDSDEGENTSNSLTPKKKNSNKRVKTSSNKGSESAGSDEESVSLSANCISHTGVEESLSTNSYSVNSILESSGIAGSSSGSGPSSPASHKSKKTSDKSLKKKTSNKDKVAASENDPASSSGSTWSNKSKKKKPSIPNLPIDSAALAAGMSGSMLALASGKTSPSGSAPRSGKSKGSAPSSKNNTPRNETSEESVK